MKRKPASFPRGEPLVHSVRWVDDSEGASPKGWPFDLPAVRACQGLRFAWNVTFFAGENGSGKSTLLEGIAESLQLNPEGGPYGADFSTRSSHSALGRYLLPVRSQLRKRTAGAFLRAESFYNVATYLENSESLATRFHRMSHGESFLELIDYWTNFDPCVLLMDEPESALSPDRQLLFLLKMSDMTQRGWQFIVASHSPILLAFPDAKIYGFSATGVEEIRWEDLDHVRTNRAFFAHKDRMFREMGLVTEPTRG